MVTCADDRSGAQAAEPAHAVTVPSAAASTLRAWNRCSTGGAPIPTWMASL